jgi:hypothetical protein
VVTTLKFPLANIYSPNLNFAGVNPYPNRQTLESAIKYYHPASYGYYQSFVGPLSKKEAAELILPDKAVHNRIQLEQCAPIVGTLAFDSYIIIVVIFGKALFRSTGIEREIESGDRMTFSCEIFSLESKSLTASVAIACGKSMPANAKV